MMRSERVQAGIGHGAYSYAEASMILGASRARIARWADGYTYPRKADIGKSDPVLQTDRAHKGVISFHELIELFFVQRYTSLGVPLKNVRDTAKALSPELGPYPFASGKLKTDGRILAREDGVGLIRPDVRQYVADFAAEFFEHVGIQDDLAVRFYPEAGKGLIVLHAERLYGQPIVEDGGVPTAQLYRLFKAEQNWERVADWFEIPVRSVKAAVDFEVTCRQVA